VTDVARFRALLSPSENERFDSYRNDADRRRFLTGRTLARFVLAEQLDMPAARIEFDATCADCGKPHGPPRLAGSELVFSITHSGERVGLALCHDAAVGLDVEGTNRNVTDRLLSYALNRTELATFDGLPSVERAGRFFTYWVRKEAVMKATGRGLELPLRRITLAGSAGQPRLIDSGDPTVPPETTRLADLSPGSGYAAALAVLATSELTVHERWWKPPGGSAPHDSPSC